MAKHLEEILKTGEVIVAEDGCFLVCDKAHHYAFSPAFFGATETCDCNGIPCLWGGLPSPARPRYEVYDKDPEFFWDHKHDILVWIKITSELPGMSTPDASEYAKTFVRLMNMNEYAKLLQSV